MNNKIEPGYCQCGCGQKTRIAPVNDASKGWKKGEPVRFVKGHTIKGGCKGENALRWKGGRHAKAGGYIEVWTPDGRRYEHVLIAERALGRRLRENEVVHHINGVKSYNRRDNLLVCTNAYHQSLHARLEKSESWPEFSINPRNGGAAHV